MIERLQRYFVLLLLFAIGLRVAEWMVRPLIPLLFMGIVLCAAVSLVLNRRL